MSRKFKNVRLLLICELVCQIKLKHISSNVLISSLCDNASH